jgi:exosortase family protein XrtM
MEPLLSVTGVPYMPDEGEALPAPQPRPFSMVVYVLASISLFTGLQLLWGAMRYTDAERILIDNLLVVPAAAIVNILTPQVGAIADGQFIRAPGGGLEIVSACTGTEVYFLLTAALCVFPMSWRNRIEGIVLGIAFVFALNHLRILALFYLYRWNLILFDYIHGIFMPIVLILATCLYFLWWTASHATSADTARHAIP